MPLGANKAAIMGVAGVSTADVVLLSTQTASSSASLSFTSDLTSTYGEYIFGLYTLHPQTDTADMTFNASIDGGSNYNVTKTTTYFRAYQTEAGADATLSYDDAKHIYQGTGYQILNASVDNDADGNCVGKLHLFNPASTTYVKQFYYTSSTSHSAPAARNEYVSGYFNTTSAVNAVAFKFSSGNIDVGKIKMWGVK